MVRSGKAIIILITLLLVASCKGGPATSQEGTPAALGETILIGVAWPFSVTQHKLREGIELAQQEINDAGGVLGASIELWFEDDQGSVAEGRRIAQQFADDPDVIAVIGHYNSSVSIPSSTIYQFAHILMLSPGSTNPQLTRQGFDLVFRNIPTDEEFGRQLAYFAHRQGYRRMAILAAKDTYGRGLANIFEKRAGDLGIEIVDRFSYPQNSEPSFFRQILERWQEPSGAESSFADAIFIAGTTPEAAYFIRQARQMGITVPIMGGDGLDSPDLWRIGGEAAEGTVVATPFHPDKSEVFKAAFYQKYGTMPDTWAAQGYDALKLLAYAMQEAESVDAEDIAAVLRSLKGWPGVTGPHTFDANGDVVGKPIVLQKVENSGFVYLADAYTEQ